MKLIPLYGIRGIGKFAMVDDEDYDYLIQWRWRVILKSNALYAQRSETINEFLNRKRKIVLMHRV
ncbi:MAG: hypothetical protein AABY22_34190, partial [Nanoarchaeota archaeon]